MPSVLVARRRSVTTSAAVQSVSPAGARSSDLLDVAAGQVEPVRRRAPRHRRHAEEHLVVVRRRRAARPPRRRARRPCRARRRPGRSASAAAVRRPGAPRAAPRPTACTAHAALGRTRGPRRRGPARPVSGNAVEVEPDHPAQRRLVVGQQVDRRRRRSAPGRSRRRLVDDLEGLADDRGAAVGAALGRTRAGSSPRCPRAA